MTFGEKIKKLRVKNNWTQEQFAEMMGVSAQAVSRWETDSSMPDILMLAPIAYTFNVSCDYLLGVDLNSKERDIFRIRKEAWESIVEENPNKWINAYNMISEGLKLYPDSWMLIKKLTFSSDTCMALADMVYLRTKNRISTISPSSISNPHHER